MSEKSKPDVTRTADGLPGGEMAERVRSYDWAATPLGPIETWPQSLKTVVDLILASGFPMVALWGSHLIQIYDQKRLEDELRQLNEELEERVRGRTLELAATNEQLQGEVQERRTAEEQVKRLLRQLVTIQEEERRRIARELHDTLGQQLAALRLSIEMLKSKADGQQELHAEADPMWEIFQRLDSDVDFLAWELRPASLDHFGLSATLENFVQEWSRHFRIRADYHGLGPNGSRLPAEVETNLYRILQEALQNVHKHSGASRVSVLLERHGNEVVLIVEDNGKGYDAEAEVAASSSKGMGVVNMRERAALVGGRLEIETSPGEGVTIYVRVPLESAN